MSSRSLTRLSLAVVEILSCDAHSKEVTYGSKFICSSLCYEHAVKGDVLAFVYVRSEISLADTENQIC